MCVFLPHFRCLVNISRARAVLAQGGTCLRVLFLTRCVRYNTRTHNHNTYVQKILNEENDAIAA